MINHKNLTRPKVHIFVTMKPHISSLPEELIEQIFKDIRQHASSRDLWKCIMTCRRWYRIGLPLITSLSYSTTAIIESDFQRNTLEEEQIDTNIQVVAYFPWHSPSQAFLSELRCLTIHVLHKRIAGTSRPLNIDFFNHLTYILQTTRKLTTFSLKFADDGWSFPYSDIPAVPQSRIARLISALPPTVRDLEIDTMGVDLPSGELIISTCPSDHLCYQLNNIFPKLHHIRLRVRHLCCAVFDFVDSELSTDLDKAPWFTKKSCHVRSMTFWQSPAKPQDFISFQNRYKDATSPQNPHFPHLTSRLMIRLHPFRGRNAPAARRGIWQAYGEQSGHDIDRRTKNFSEGYYPLMVEGEDNAAPLLGRQCEECARIETPFRRFLNFSADSMRNYNRPYMAEWHLEGDARWAQDGHRGPRYPNLEANHLGKAFRAKENQTPYACLYPRCRFRCVDLERLLVHNQAMHPKFPNEDVVNGMTPCPSIGCDHVGLWGFCKKSELEQHLFEHHRGPCKKRKRRRLPYLPGSPSANAYQLSFRRPDVTKSRSLGSGKPDATGSKLERVSTEGCT